MNGPKSAKDECIADRRWFCPFVYVSTRLISTFLRTDYDGPTHWDTP